MILSRLVLASGSSTTSSGRLMMISSLRENKLFKRRDGGMRRIRKPTRRPSFPCDPGRLYVTQIRSLLFWAVRVDSRKVDNTYLGLLQFAHNQDLPPISSAKT